MAPEQRELNLTNIAAGKAEDGERSLLVPELVTKRGDFVEDESQSLVVRHRIWVGGSLLRKKCPTGGNLPGTTLTMAHAHGARMRSSFWAMPGDSGVRQCQALPTHVTRSGRSPTLVVRKTPQVSETAHALTFAKAIYPDARRNWRDVGGPPS